MAASATSYTSLEVDPQDQDADQPIVKEETKAHSSLKPKSSIAGFLESKKDLFGNLVRPILLEHNLKDKENGKLCYYFMCPFHGKVAMWATKIVAAIAIWGTFWAITGDQALPGGNFFGLLVLMYGCVLASAFINLTPLPPLLGMMIVGFCIRNAPGLDTATAIDKTWASTLRTIALVVILIRAGAGLDPQALKKVKWMAIRLAFVPSLVEALAVALVARFGLDFPWIWAFIVGFVLSAVSPAVVVPSMIGVQEKGYGVDEGIPTLCIAACSLNDVFSISGFGVTLGIAFSNADLVYNIFHGPLEIIIGITFGVSIGVLLWYLPNIRSKNLLMYRFIMVVALGMFATFGFRVVKYPGAGALGTLTMAFVAGIGWRKRGWDTHYPIKPILARCWQVFQPLLFGLIGNAVSIENLQSGDMGLSIAMLFVGLAFRLLVTFFAAYGMGFSVREKLFITVAWLPKATVQAAIGPLALDTAIAKGADDNIIRVATTILTVAVLSILITAPLGATGIATTAPLLLKKGHVEEDLLEEGDSADETENKSKRSDLCNSTTELKQNQELHKSQNELFPLNGLSSSQTKLHTSQKELHKSQTELSTAHTELPTSQTLSSKSNEELHQKLLPNDKDTPC